MVSGLLITANSGHKIVLMGIVQVTNLSQS